MIEIYTDGACNPNPGPGGWAAIVVENGSESELHGRQQRTTSNRMEMLAVIKGLEAVPDSSAVTVFSDSQYVVMTMTRNWKRRANNDLWARLDTEVSKRAVTWEWLPGHAGIKYNEEAHKLASQEAAGKLKKTDDAPLSHVDESGKARMVDVGSKPVTQRTAVARGSVIMRPDTLERIRSNDFDKGDVLGVARVAGVMAAKDTARLIPLCHPLPIDQVVVDFKLDEEGSAIRITATAKTMARTGVEMEALTAVSVAALTIYDMCKSVDRGMRIDGIRLASKTGGRSGDIVLEA